MNFVLQHFILKYILTISVMNQFNIWNRNRCYKSNENHNEFTTNNPFSSSSNEEQGTIVNNKQGTTRVNDNDQSHDWEERKLKKQLQTVVLIHSKMTE